MKENIRINVIVNIIRTIVLTLLSFITFPWVCRYLGDEMVGVYTWINTFIGYFLILAKVGIPNLALRECVKVRDDKEKLSNVAQLFVIIQMCTTIISFILMSITVLMVPALKENYTLIFLLSLNFLTGAFSFEWLFIALEKQFYMAIRSIITLSLSAILVVTFVTSPSDIYIYALLTTLYTAITTIVNLINAKKYISFKKTMPYNLKMFIRPMINLTVISFVISLYNQIDTFTLGFIDESKKEVASYSVGVKGIDIIISIMTSLSTVFVPRSAYYYEKEDKRFFFNLTRYSMNICLFIVVPAIITMSILSQDITSLISGNFSSDINSSYGSAKYVLIILSIMMLTYSLSDMIYGQILLPMKKEKHYLYALLCGSGLNLILSLIFGIFVFKNNPAIGIAIATLISELCVFTYLAIYSWKYIKKALFNMNTLKILIAGILITVASLLLYHPVELLLNNFITSTSLIYLLRLIIIVAVDAIIYIGTLLILKEDLIYSFIRKKPKPI
ncbi:MAG: oligosaccharide flippase family protein [Bacilli bacterium]